jgi:hypothetical protein
MSTFKQTKTTENLARINIYNNTLRIQYTSTFFETKGKTYLLFSVLIYLDRIVWNICAKILMLRKNRYVEYNGNNRNIFYETSTALKPSIQECQYLLIVLSNGLC